MSDAYITARDRVAGEYTFTIRDKHGAVVPVLGSLVLSLYLEGSDTYLNGRNKQDVLGAGAGANNVTFAAGVVTWHVQPADNALAGDASETHIALFEWTAPGEDDFHEVSIRVPNTRIRPTPP